MTGQLGKDKALAGALAPPKTPRMATDLWLCARTGIARCPGCDSIGTLTKQSEEAHMEPEIRDLNFYGEAERELIPLVELVEKILKSFNIVEVWPEKNVEAA